MSKILRNYNAITKLARSGVFWREFKNPPMNTPTSLYKKNIFDLGKIHNFDTINKNIGIPKVSKLTVANFHTTRSCKSLGSFAYAFFKPLVNIFGIIVGRRFKSWWGSLSASRKKEISQNLKGHTNNLLVGSSAILMGCYFFYLIHLTETPITKRKRFIVYTKNKMLQVSEMQNKLLQSVHNRNILPSTSNLHKRVSKIINQILKSNADIPEIKNSSWSINVVVDPLQKNVFVLPDGNVYVFSGILDFCKNDDQLAFILSHEISHVLLSHVEENISKSYFMEMIILLPIMLFWATLPGEGAVISHWAVNRMNQIMFNLPFCRSIEMEADYVGLQLMAKACYDVREAIKFWNSMKKLQAEEFSIQSVEWLSTHPDSGRREQHLNELLPAALLLRSSCNVSSSPQNRMAPFISQLRQIISKFISVSSTTEVNDSKRNMYSEIKAHLLQEYLYLLQSERVPILETSSHTDKSNLML